MGVVGAVLVDVPLLLILLSEYRVEFLMGMEMMVMVVVVVDEIGEVCATGLCVEDYRRRMFAARSVTPELDAKPEPAARSWLCDASAAFVARRRQAFAVGLAGGR